MLWIHRTVDVDPEAAWAACTDLGTWGTWGPSVRSASLDDPDVGFVAGATGRVVTAPGPSLPFRLTRVDDGPLTTGREWRWAVAGVPATAHSVAADERGRAVLGFGVPTPAAPYLVVCAVALRRMARLLDG